MRQIVELCTSLRPGTSRKEIFCNKKVKEFDRTETSIRISTISFIISFNKAGEFFYVSEEKQLCWRKSWYLCSIQFGIVSIIKFQSGCDDDQKVTKFKFLYYKSSHLYSHWKKFFCGWFISDSLFCELSSIPWFILFRFLVNLSASGKMALL